MPPGFYPGTLPVVCLRNHFQLSTTALQQLHKSSDSIALGVGNKVPLRFIAPPAKKSKADPDKLTHLLQGLKPRTDIISLQFLRHPFQKPCSRGSGSESVRLLEAP